MNTNKDAVKQAISDAGSSLATIIANAAGLKGDAHLNVGLQLERGLRRFAEAILEAAQSSDKSRLS